MSNEEIKSTITEMLSKLGIPVSEVSVTEDGPKSRWFSAEVKEPHYFFERGGEAVFALNHLIRKMIDTEGETGPETVIDINGFQKKRVEGVRSVAHMMAERARYFKSNIEVDPMPAFERRVIHEFLSDATDLKTESQGEGRTRRVVIKYIGEL